MSGLSRLWKALARHPGSDQGVGQCAARARLSAWKGNDEHGEPRPDGIRINETVDIPNWLVSMTLPRGIFT